MNAYSPPQSPIDGGPPHRVGAVPRIALFPVIALGACLTWQLTLWLSFHVPIPPGSRTFKIAFFLMQSACLSIATAAPWWIPIGYIYQRRALLVGALVALVPVILRIILSGSGPMSATATAMRILDTAGLVAAMAIGAHIAGHRLSGEFNHQVQHLGNEL